MDGKPMIDEDMKIVDPLKAAKYTIDYVGVEARKCHTDVCFQKKYFDSTKMNQKVDGDLS